ncbi:Leptomycin B resistance protein pmd1 [Colletotrichum sp. SAR 10_99]|nr:Leptomycin B resistance protein pmd1 [Colletotrichum sp. SAR 10_99]
MQLVAATCALASGVGMAMVNLVFGQFITVITDFTTGASSPGEFRSESARLALYFFIIGIGRFVVSYGYSTLFTLAAYRITRNIRHAYLKAGLTQEIAYFDSGIGGSVAVQATSHGRLVQAGISEKLGLVIQGLSAFISAFVLAFVTNWKLTLITGCIAPATIFVMSVASYLEAAIEIQILGWNAQAGSFAESILASARTVQAFALRSRLITDFNTYLEKSAKLGRKKNPILGCLFSAEYFILFSGIGLCFWQAIGMLARGETKAPGDVFIVLMSVIVAASSLTTITPYLIDFTRAATAAVGLFRLIDRKSIIDPLDQSGDQPHNVIGNIDFENVSFSYPMRPDTKVLDNYSLHIPAGKTTALVGASGSGKSTIVGLLERWNNPASGTITLDGRPIEQLNLQWLRKQIRLVQQEPILFSGTVYDNIVNGLVGTPWENEPREAKLARVQQAAEIAFAHDFIKTLPNGYDTVIGERGGLLSGEQVVQQALDNVSRGRTTITIAHKLATIRDADNIVVMKQGQIIEQGTHDALLAMNGAYSRLVMAQDLAITEEPSDSTSNSDTIAEDEDKSVRLSHALTRYSTATRLRAEQRIDKDNFDNWKRVGFCATVWRLLKCTPELRWYYAALTAACFIAAAAYPGQAILMSRFIEVFKFTGSQMQKKGNFFALMFFVVGIGAFVVYFVIGWCSNTTATVCSTSPLMSYLPSFKLTPTQTFNQKMRRELVDNMLKQDLQFFDRPENTTGALTSRTDSYPQAVFELMGFNISLILVSIVSVLACSILALAYGWRLGVVIVFAGLPPMLFAGYVRIRMESAMDAKISKRFSSSASIASEAITAIRTVSSLSIEKSVLERYTRELDHANSFARRPILLIMLPFAFTQSVEYAFMALGFWYGCRLVSFGDMSTVNFFVAFLGVFFSGQSETKVLQGVDLSIKKGQFVAFVGASGCGKSTMIAILERFYDPVSGHLRVDSVDVDRMNPWLFRKDVALVQQEPVLYPGTIRHNISMGIPTEDLSTISDGSIIEACRMANAWEFISSLPEGLDTQCGANGTQLSGGQRQRIAIARALIQRIVQEALNQAASSDTLM